MVSTARHWILTIPERDFSPGPQPELVGYLCGQLEIGDGGFRHWQVYLIVNHPCRLTGIKKLYPTAHVEATRSGAAEAYCSKDDTRVPDSQFTYGEKPFRRNVATDWSAVRELAQRGELEKIPADVYVRCYNQLSRIRTDYLRPVAIERVCYVFWGATGTGKSRRAWDEAGLDAYGKDPCTKWFCGYRGQSHIVLDEFRGAIGISHLLRWLDRYPVSVENKGSALPLMATTFWITSNVDPRLWYPDLDDETLAALIRRLNITHFN